MINPSLLVFISACYLGFLFWIAFRGDKKPIGQYSSFQPVIFTLSLAVYCSSWTFFGAVGSAATNSWDYASIYIGPILVFLLGYRFLEKIVQVSKRQRTTSIADFISARYGKSPSLAALVTLIALIGTIPYIALQLKAVGAAFDTLTGRDVYEGKLSIFSDTPLYLGVALMVFSILFGARRIDATEHHRGLMNAISFESVIKLIALVIMAFFAWEILDDKSFDNLRKYGLSFDQLLPASITQSFLTNTILAAGAVICLPRQFHVTAVESRGDEIPFARWGFSVYLSIVTMAVIPITMAGIMVFKTNEISDLFILTLPMNYDEPLLSTLVYIGGFAAATSMVIVAAVALSTMVSNDLILPVWLRFHDTDTTSDYFPFLLRARQFTICVLIALGYFYQRVASSPGNLAAIGLISFAAACQFLPAMIGSVYWRRGHRYGVAGGLIAGFIVWAYTLLFPTLAEAGWLPSAFMENGILGLRILHPHSLFHSHFDNTLTHGVFWSLGLNTAIFFAVSFLSRANLTDRMQAAAFIDGLKSQPREQATVNYRITLNDLSELCNRFVGKERTRRFFESYNQQTKKLKPGDYADVGLIADIEQLLSSTIGSSSARSILDSALKATSARNEDILDLLNQTTQAIQFNRDLLQVTLDNLSQGVSVVDKDLRIVAWNQAYLEMFKYPPGFIKIGIPVEETIRFNARRELFSLEKMPVETFVNKRLDFLRHGSSYSFERTWKDGTVIKTQGNRLPDGGYVTTYTDITDYKNAQMALETAKNTLELKVDERTRSLSELNTALTEAKAEAEQATVSKTRFLAAASHDLLQPLNAGKLFLAALLEDLRTKPGQFELATNVQKSLQSAENLLKALLDISKLDAGALKPEYNVFSLTEILTSLERDFSVLAREKGLKLKFFPTPSVVHSDKNLLRSVLQNFISNAIRYTDTGTVAVCCRKRKGKLLIEVRDNGPGIPDQKQQEIFEEFRRLDKSDKAGLGLGLAITRRIADLLHVDINLRSAPGKGSTFSVLVGLATEPESAVRDRTATTHQHRKAGVLAGLRVLCVDDEISILEASSQLLKRWECEVFTAKNVDEWRAFLAEDASFDVVLADYQLNDEMTGLDILRQMQNRGDGKFCGIVVSAEHAETIRQAVRDSGFLFLPKPIEPSVLRSILTESMKNRRSGIAR